MEWTHPCPELAAPDPAFAVLPADTLGPAVTEPYARVVTCVTSTTCPDVAVPLLLASVVCHTAVYTCVVVSDGSAPTPMGVGLSTSSVLRKVAST